jgi:hypothetical protein
VTFPLLTDPAGVLSVHERDVSVASNMEITCHSPLLLKQLLLDSTEGRAEELTKVHLVIGK